ncbi:MAG: hypothetical protein JWM27_3863 [Gemmatimonadetes bacterium]|nr:hypothetical protein [Gemmatimonadota bacterium]
MTSRSLRALLLLLAAAAPAAAQEAVVSTRQDTKDLSLTVYNQGFAVVRERRDLGLHAGLNRVRYEDVAQLIDAPTVSLRSMTAPGSLAVAEQNYQYDLVSPAAILDKSVGRTVRIRRRVPNGNVEVLEGTLISSSSSGGIVVRTADGRLILSPEGEVEVQALPEGLISRPSLLWLLNAGRAGVQTAEVSYMTDGVDWSADYVVVVDSAERKVDLTGWVTLVNRSGTTYPQAQLQLIAGDVRRVTARRSLEDRRGQLSLEGVVSTAARTRQFGEEAFFEYHLYTLDTRTTIAQNETKQMTLLTAPDAGVTRRLVFDSRRAWNWDWQPGQASSTEPVKAAIVLELENSRANGMGMPLPAGVVRLYKADSRGNMQFLGEDRVDHTPRDEKVRLWIGDAFDVVATRRVVEDRAIDAHTREVTVETTLRNHKAVPTDVSIVEHFASEWRILQASHPHEREDASTGVWRLRVPADTEVKVTYTARVWWR